MKIEDVLKQLASAGESEKTAAAKTEEKPVEKTAEAVKTEEKPAAKPEISPEVLKMAEALVASPEAVKALNDMVDQEEKTAEAEKLAEELEFQGRLFARGLIAEQTKVAYLADQIDEAAVEKTAAALGMTLDELMGEKIADAQHEAYNAAKKDSGAGKRDVALNQKVTSAANAGELKGMSAVANALKKARVNVTDLPVNG